jgi:predicted LPLAT superfamily acyltransferase
MLAWGYRGFTVTATGLSHFEAAARQPSGILLLTAHFGIVEATVPLMRGYGIDRPVNMVMYRDAADHTERFHSRHRRLLAGIRIISTTLPLLAGPKIVAALRRGEWVAVRADRTLRGRSVAATLLELPVQLPSGPFTTAVLCDAPVLSVYTVRLGYRRYECILSPVRMYNAMGDAEGGGGRAAAIAGAAQDFAADLEILMRRYPLQWANFYDYWTVQSAAGSSMISNAAAGVSPT